jgi:hypothetical protein
MRKSYAGPSSSFPMMVLSRYPSVVVPLPPSTARSAASINDSTGPAAIVGCVDGVEGDAYDDGMLEDASEYDAGDAVCLYVASGAIEGASIVVVVIVVLVVAAVVVVVVVVVTLDVSRSGADVDGWTVTVGEGDAVVVEFVVVVVVAFATSSVVDDDDASISPSPAVVVAFPPPPPSFWSTMSFASCPRTTMGIDANIDNAAIAHGRRTSNGTRRRRRRVGVGVGVGGGGVGGGGGAASPGNSDDPASIVVVDPDDPIIDGLL